MAGNELVSGGLAFLAGALVTGLAGLYMRLEEKSINERKRHKALAYTYVVQLTEFLASDISLKRTVDRSMPELKSLASGESLPHVFALAWEDTLKEMPESERTAQVALLKPLIRMVEDYMEGFQLAPEKLADLPQDVVYLYNVHQMEARRAAVSMSALVDDIEHRKELVTAVAILRSMAAYRAHIVAVTSIHAGFAKVAELDESDLKALMDKSLKRQLDALDKNDLDGEHIKNLRASRESKP